MAIQRVGAGAKAQRVCPFGRCRRAALAPGGVLETCDLFLLREGRVAKRVAFLPNVPGSDTGFIFQALP